MLYADDTIVLAENENELQLALNALERYCQKWKLSVNTDKTQIMIFSRGKIRNSPVLTFGGRPLEIVYNYKYLGITFNYNGKMAVAMKYLSQQANKAMFGVLANSAYLQLTPDLKIDLFYKMIKPILMYNCEIWGAENYQVIERIQLKFLKYVLKLNKSTPNILMYGETGQMPLGIDISTRMISYWGRLICNNKPNKLSVIVYKLMHELYVKDIFKSKWICQVVNTLNTSGLGYIWHEQKIPNTKWLKQSVQLRLRDQYKQNFFAEINDTEKCYIYRMFKSEWGYEKYLSILPAKMAKLYCKFRTSNLRLPIQLGRFNNIPRHERICNFCTKRDLGDEFHTLLCCDHFNSNRKNLIPKYYFTRPNVIKFSMLLNLSNKSKLINLCRFIQIIQTECI